LIKISFSLSLPGLPNERLFGQKSVDQHHDGSVEVDENKINTNGQFLE
jgi:hypothetical protein